jgi:hypothetical protein
LRGARDVELAKSYISHRLKNAQFKKHTMADQHTPLEKDITSTLTKVSEAEASAHQKSDSLSAQ